MTVAGDLDHGSSCTMNGLVDRYFFVDWAIYDVAFAGIWPTRRALVYKSELSAFLIYLSADANVDGEDKEHDEPYRIIESGDSEW
jgi:hypothetical protein